MSINMAAKKDLYLANPGHYIDDLNNQTSVWLDNLVRPLAGHYEAALENTQKVHAEVARRKEETARQLARIEAIQGIVLSVVFAGIDICSAAALKNVTVLSRYGRNRGLEHFLEGGADTASAVRDFLSQPNFVSDTILGSLDEKIRGLAQTGSVTSAIQTVSRLTQSVSVAASVDPSANWPGPVQFKSNMETQYSSTARAIREAYIELIRDSSASAAEKASLMDIFVHLPFLRPPTLSMASFGMFYECYFEACYWCDYVSNVPDIGLLNATGRDTSRVTGVMRDGVLADVINERLRELTGLYLTHTGSRNASEATPSQNANIKLAWDGWVNDNTHASHLAKMRSIAYTQNIQPLLISAGNSTTIFS